MTVNIFDPRIKFIQCQGQNMLLKIYMHDIVINNVTGTYKVLTDDSEFISRRRYQAQIMKIKFYSCFGRLLTLHAVFFFNKYVDHSIYTNYLQHILHTHVLYLRVNSNS